MLLSEKYASKVDSLWSLCERLDVDFDDLITSKYGHECFEGSEIRKVELFAKLYHLHSVNDDSVTYLNQRASNDLLKHHKDARLPIEYALDLILGWLAEDIIFFHFENLNLEIKSNGKDINREILSASQVSADSDFQIMIQEQIINLELMVDWNGYWEKTNRCDVRSSKIEKLIQSSGIFLGIDANRDLCILSRFNSNTQHNWQYINSHRPFGGKSVWSLQNLSELFVNIEEVIKLLLSQR